MQVISSLPNHAIAPHSISNVYNTPASTMAAPASVHVCVEGVPFQYQLTEDDLMKVFSRYGCVANIKIMDEGGSAIVQFATSQDATRAATLLDGKVLNGVHGALRVSMFPALPSHPASSEAFASKHPTLSMVSNSRKYTCKFEVPSDLDAEFCVAKRIIGQKGFNMKKIVSLLPSADAAKLRLRGKGSGFLEGPLQQESNEALHLCVSCRDAESYAVVIKEVTKLLEDVYRQYNQWCLERGFQNQSSFCRAAITTDQGENGTYFDGNSGYSQAYGPKSLYPPMWNQMVGVQSSFKPSREYGQTPSPLAYSTNVCGSTVYTPPDVPSPRNCPLEVGAIERLIEDRNEARRTCNFKEADRLRDILKSYGIGLMDEPGARGKGTEVTTWRYTGGSNILKRQA